MGFLRSLFGRRAARSADVGEFANAIATYCDSINMLFIPDPLENQLQNPEKRKVILPFLFGSADFVGKHIKKMDDDDVLAGFAAALEIAFGLSQSQALKAREDAADWSGDYDGRLCMQQGAKAFVEFMDHKTPASKPLRIMLAFSNPADLRQFLENGADFDGLMEQS